MDPKVLIAPLAGLVICFLTTYFSTQTTITGALVVAVTTSVSVLVVNILIERTKRLAKARLDKRMNTGVNSNK
jgi:uncharacterized membrane protein